MSGPLQMLIAEDSPEDATLLLRALHNAGLEFEYHVVDNEADYLRHLHAGLDIIISDYQMPQFGGARALQILRERGLDIPFVIVSGMTGEELAVEVMKMGATDYLLKDRLDRIGLAISQALEQGRMRKERQKVAAALRESEERFREVVQNIEQVFWMVHVETGEMLFVSDAYEKVWGRSCESLYANPGSWLEAVHPEDRERVEKASGKKIEGPFHEEYRIVRPDGRVRWISDRAFPVHNAGGSLYRIAGIAEDITERKCAEARVHEQAEMLDLAHDAIIIRGFEDYVITFWNKGAEYLYGWAAEEAIGHRIDELIFLRPERIQMVNEGLLQTGEWRGENEHVARGGGKLIVSSRATLVRDEQGMPKSVFVINTDITGQKELEARLLRAQRMESIGTLASGVAHDLNNILAPIMMSVPLLRRELSAKTREELISSIELCVARGAEIVKQVLTFGRGLEGERRPMQLATVIRDIGKMLAETFPKDIHIETSLPANLWPVMGDSTQLHQVVLNLCVNARDAMTEGGTLKLRASNVELDESYVSMLPGATLGHNVLLEVEDTGSGIPPEVVERIFDPFFTTKGVGKGTGLGLSTVMGIVRSHGGHIGVKTELGRGTTFLLHLPAADKDAADERPATPAPAPRGHGECILVVDDEEAVRNSVRFALEDHGYTVTLATDGAEALALFAQNVESFALVLTDLMMPYMDGIAFIHAVRRIKPDIPIIASSGLAGKRQLTELEILGVNGILLKPFGNDTMLHRVGEALQSRT